MERLVISEMSPIDNAVEVVEQKGVGHIRTRSAMRSQKFSHVLSVVNAGGASNPFTAAAYHCGSGWYVDPAGAVAMRADVVVDTPCCMAGRAFGPLVFGNCEADDPRASRRIRKRPAAFLADFVERSHGSTASRTDPDRPSKRLRDHNDRAYKDWVLA